MKKETVTFPKEKDRLITAYYKQMKRNKLYFVQKFIP